MPESNIAVTPGVGQPVDTFTQASGVHRQAVVIGDPVASPAANVFPSGELSVRAEPTQLFYDPFAALDTVNNWNTPVTGNSAVAATASAGVMSLATGTVASGYSVLTSQPVFHSSTPGWIRFAANIALPDGAAPIANSYRFWGGAVPQAVPTPANPIANGAGFELATTGKMYAVVYNAGTRVQVADLSSGTGTGVQPNDAAQHNYQVFCRPVTMYWFIDTVLVATSTLIQSETGTDAFSSTFMAVGGSTPPVSSVILSSAAASVSDTTAANATVSDATYLWRRAAVVPKGAQGSYGLANQDLKDSGRNVTNYFMALPVVATTAEVMQSLTGYKSGAAVGATATPAVVTAGKTYRIIHVEITYVSVAALGGALIRLRANLAGVAVVTSPLVKNWAVGCPTAAAAGEMMTYSFEYAEGLEFPAGTGIAVGVVGLSSAMVAGTAAGFVGVSIEGYEY